MLIATIQAAANGLIRANRIRRPRHGSGISSRPAAIDQPIPVQSDADSGLSANIVNKFFLARQRKRSLYGRCRFLNQPTSKSRNGRVVARSINPC